MRIRWALMNHERGDLIVIAVSVVGMKYLQTDTTQLFIPWWGYLVAVLVYTALVFRDDGWSKEGPLHFSKLDSPTIRRFVIIHAGFLAILVVMLEATTILTPSCPTWISDLFRVRGVDYSMLQILVILGAVALHFVERRWLLTVYSETCK